jgi:hypothetical protein
MISPLNSAGERTSTRASVRRHVGGQRQPVVQPELATAVQDPDVAVAEQLELPVGPGGEPVVVVAVQDDRRVGADAARAEQLAEIVTPGDVATDAVGQLARPVPGDGAGDVALLVARRVDVDFNEADGRVVEVALGPVGVDEDVGGVSGNGHVRLLRG